MSPAPEPPNEPDFVAEIFRLDLDTLFVDEEYQRDIIPWKVRNLSRNWNWNKFLPLIVTPRRPGSFAILDGQQRWLAAKERGITSLPCVVITNSSGVEAEVDRFLGANDTVQVEPLDKFRARLSKGEPKAVAINSLVEQCGFSVPDRHVGSRNGRPWQIRAISAAEKLFDQERLEIVLVFLRQTWPTDADALGKADILTGTSLALAHLVAHGAQMGEASRKLSMEPLRDLKRRAAARQDAAMSKTSSTAAFAQVFVDVYNWRRQKAAVPPYGVSS